MRPEFEIRNVKFLQICGTKFHKPGSIPPVVKVSFEGKELLVQIGTAKKPENYVLRKVKLNKDPQTGCLTLLSDGLKLQFDEDVANKAFLEYYVDSALINGVSIPAADANLGKNLVYNRERKNIRQQKQQLQLQQQHEVASGIQHHSNSSTPIKYHSISRFNVGVPVLGYSFLSASTGPEELRPSNIEQDWFDVPSPAGSSLMDEALAQQNRAPKRAAPPVAPPPPQAKGQAGGQPKKKQKKNDEAEEDALAKQDAAAVEALAQRSRDSKRAAPPLAPPPMPPPLVTAPQRQTRKTWTEKEVEVFIKGVEAHGPGNWRKILDDQRFGMELKDRNNGNLKDKWRNLEEDERNSAICAYKEKKK